MSLNLFDVNNVTLRDVSWLSQFRLVTLITNLILIVTSTTIVDRTCGHDDGSRLISVVGNVVAR